MAIKALFLDFYGTIVHEDDDIIPVICEEIRSTAEADCSLDEIGSYWWRTFSAMCRQSYGESFQDQRTIGLKSLKETIERFQSSAIGERIIEKQFAHWMKPGIFADSIGFLRSLDLPAYVLSNIDTCDVLAAIDYHGLPVGGVITSEDVRAYKPRSEMFIAALGRFGLDASEVLHVGDSLVSDIQGAQQAGIAAVWMNRKGKPLPADRAPNFVVGGFDELKRLL